ncbi:thioredoxin domain-containing protein [Candidatus Woesearchaeota archaeon]|nr:thioredoxin domain-containing protein [Candidatus Woesearchaeota archaeon]
MGKSNIIMLICIIFLALVIYAFAGFGILSNNNILFKDSMEQKDWLTAYRALTFQSPAIEGRPCLGLQSAPLSIIVVVDFKSDFSKQFYNEKMPEIMQQYIKSGQARLYHKYYITKEELIGKKGRFIYASASRCYNEFAFNNTIEFNQALFNTQESNIGILAEEFNIPKEEFLKCLSESNFQALSKDMLETEKFDIQSPSIYLGVNGGDNTMLIGNPSIELIQKRMRMKQIKVGI